MYEEGTAGREGWCMRKEQQEGKAGGWGSNSRKGSIICTLRNSRTRVTSIMFSDNSGDARIFFI